MKRLSIKHLLTKNAPTKGASVQPLSATPELQLTTDLPQRQSKASKTTRETTWKAGQDRAAGAMTNPDLISVIFLCIIACLIAANLILRVPDAGLTVELFNQF